MQVDGPETKRYSTHESLKLHLVLCINMSLVSVKLKLLCLMDHLFFLVLHQQKYIIFTLPCLALFLFGKVVQVEKSLSAIVSKQVFWT